MPIITPAYPSMCATHNVTSSTQAVMQEEFDRGCEVMNPGDKPTVDQGAWEVLFEKDDFFYRYKNYLCIVASADSEEVHLKWSSFVESRLRQLVMRLEEVDGIAIAHPFIKYFERTTKCYTEQDVTNATNGTFENQVSESTEEPIKTVYTALFFIGLRIQAVDQVTNGTRKLDLAGPNNAFQTIAKAWDQYNEAKMGIVVRNLKQSMIPSYILKDNPPPAKGSKKRNKVRLEPRTINVYRSEYTQTKNLWQKRLKVTNKTSISDRKRFSKQHMQCSQIGKGQP
jgi:poly(A) polymerase